MSVSVPAAGLAPAITLRRATAADGEAVSGLVPDEEDLFLCYAQGRHPFSAEQAVRLIAKRMEPTVLLVGGKLAGFGCFYRFRPAKSVFVGNVAIDPQRRGEGLGRRLVCHLTDLAFDGYGLTRVKIHVFHRNLAALTLYCNLGFEPYAMRRRADYAGNNIMLLSLALTRDAWQSERARVAGLTVGSERSEDSAR